jgi:hypothetical protein
MPLATKNGTPYPDLVRPDELPRGVPDAQPGARQERKAGGRGIQKGAKDIPAMGGRARKGRTKLTHEVQGTLPVSERLRGQARFMRRKTCAELARTVGAGTCGLIASALVKLASEDLAMREECLARGDVEVAQRLGVSARGHLLSAREVAARDGENRPRTSQDFVAEMRAKILGEKP